MIEPNWCFFRPFQPIVNLDNVILVFSSTSLRSFRVPRLTHYLVSYLSIFYWIKLSPICMISSHIDIVLNDLWILLTVSIISISCCWLVNQTLGIRIRGVQNYSWWYQVSWIFKILLLSIIIIFRNNHLLRVVVVLDWTIWCKLYNMFRLINSIVFFILTFLWYWIKTHSNILLLPKWHVQMTFRRCFQYALSWS